MRLIVRNELRLSASVRTPGVGRVPGPSAAGDARRAWIEALFGEHLPRTRQRRDAAIDVLAADRSVWALLHQARHSMAETTATIERLARRALAEVEPLRAA
jgi:hypothetical protein